GLGVSPDIAYLVRETALLSEAPVIIDADGINSVVGDIEFIKQMKAPLVLTPHPKEFSRLTGLSVREIESDRIGVARKFAAEYGVWLVLKGANTVVATPGGKIYVNVSGNPGMATGGSGDVLAGIILALLARESSVTEAVLKAVRLHGDAADAAALKLGEIPLLPRDIIAELPSLFKTK
ncbi:MAG: NAD(P)H-hydrate dehydratase, partial [Clostridia bacterium]|nr:NAD(P)H-hydrate dehydratase [Clostridia bacterium]